jgi:adenylate cyclase
MLGWRGPASFFRFKAALAEGATDAAVIRLEDWLQDDARIAPQHLEVHEALAAALRDPALRDRTRATIDAAARAWPETEWIHLYLALGLIDAAIEEALRPKPLSGQVTLMLIWSPVDREFRQHPRFLEWAAREGLVEYWQRHGDPDYCRPTGGDRSRLECDR